MTIAARLQALRARISSACAAAGRDPAAVTLVAVSKGHGTAAIEAALATGQRVFGENRIGELAEKATALSAAAPVWHMIGSVQTNKVATLMEVAGLALVHSLDRVGLADALQARWRAREPLACLLEVAATGEREKHGVQPADAAPLLRHVQRACPALRVVGLMAMGPREGDPHPVFAAVAALRARLQQAAGCSLPVLSMGMTGDLEAAVAAGSTMVRVGTGIFGERTAPSR